MRKPRQSTSQPRRARDLTVADRRQVIEQLGFGRELNDPALAHLAEASSALDVGRRRFIYRAGDPADAVFLIAEGRIKLSQIEESTGREAIIDIAHRHGCTVYDANLNLTIPPG